MLVNNKNGCCLLEVTEFVVLGLIETFSVVLQKHLGPSDSALKSWLISETVAILDHGILVNSWFKP